jgi:hypothetical protein
MEQLSMGDDRPLAPVLLVIQPFEDSIVGDLIACERMIETIGRGPLAHYVIQVVVPRAITEQ